MRVGRILSVVVATAIALLLVVGIWEGYKWVGQQTGDYWPGTSIDLPASTDDLTMPHAIDIAEELFEAVSYTHLTLPTSDLV